MTTIKLRRDSSSGWTTSNPVLAAGEPGVERNTGNLKIGDGTTAWNDLPYVAQQLAPTINTAGGNSETISVTVFTIPGSNANSSSANFS